MQSLRYPCLAELKYDGEAEILINHAGKWAIINKYGTMRTQWKLLDEICLRVPTDISLIGELTYRQGLAGALYDLLSNKENEAELTIKVFDIYGEKHRHLSLLDRKEMLISMIDRQYLGDTCLIENKAHLEEYFKLAAEAGWEGIVAKNLDSPFVVGPCTWVKMKKKDQINFPVISIDKTKERIEVSVTTLRGTGHISTKVGVKVCNRIKSTLQVGDLVTIEHQGILASGSLRHPVFVKKWDLFK